MNTLPVDECKKEILAHARRTKNTEEAFGKLVASVLRWEDVETIATLENAIKAYKDVRGENV